MSLFKARDWWSVRVGDGEEFDRGSLCIANIDNDPSGNDKVIVGGFSGVLRIYYPRARNYRPDDLLLEQALDAPILQIEAGRFIPNTSQLGLAVLHPRKLAVYLVIRGGGGGFTTLQKQYEHPLERSAFSFVHGPFGGVYGRDLICVQSLDGQLAFFDQDTFAFSRFLNNFLVPGALCYIPKTDTFISPNAHLHIDCYKYHMLAASSGSSEKEGDAAASSVVGKRVQVDWSLNVGEDIVTVLNARFSRSLTSSQSDIVVIGDRTLLCVKETGSVRQQKRLDFFPSAVCSYYANAHMEEAAGGSAHNLIIATHTCQLLVFKDMQMVWCAKVPSVPVAIKVASFGGLSGLVVTLDDEGSLQVSYLGTDPSNSVSRPIGEGKELNYEEMDEEHRRLQAVIRHALTVGKQEPKDRIILRAQVPTTLDPDIAEVAEDGSMLRVCTLRVFLTYTGDDVLENVELRINVQQPLVTPMPFIVVPQVMGGGAHTPVVVGVRIMHLPGTDVLVSSLNCDLVASYLSSNGEPHTSTCRVSLPLCIAGQVVPPLKNPQFKITLDTNRMPPQLSTLFEDVIGNSMFGDGLGGAASANVLTFQYYSGHDATILVSKSAGRFRIQSGTFEALWLLSNELVRRLNLYFASRAEDLQIAYQEAVPFPEYFAAIDAHFDCRKSLHDDMSILGDRAHQFRAIQKRLLVRFKDKNPASLGHLDSLFDGTYRQLMDVSSKVESEQASLRSCSNRLSCATSLVLLLLKYRSNLTDEDSEALQQYLTPEVVDTPEQGWEEVADAAMCQLLRSVLSRNAKEAASQPQPLAGMPSDTSKLKKHIALVFDRIQRGVFESQREGGAGPSGGAPAGASRSAR